MQNEKSVENQRIQKLEAENRRLVQELTTCKRKLEAREKAFDEFKASVTGVKEEYESGIKEMKAIKRQYKDAISMANEARETYTKQMQQLINQVKQ